MLTVADSVENKGIDRREPDALRLRPPHRDADTQGYYILHEGLLGDPRASRAWRNSTTPTSTRNPCCRQPRGPALRRGDRRLVRHHRQILGRRARARPEDAVPGRLHGHDGPRRRGRPIRPTLLPDAADAPGRHGRAWPRPVHDAAVRRRQGGQDARPLRERTGVEQFKLLIDWGWFWFITQPMFKLLRQALQAPRQFRPRRSWP